MIVGKIQKYLLTFQLVFKINRMYVSGKIIKTSSVYLLMNLLLFLVSQILKFFFKYFFNVLIVPTHVAKDMATAAIV